MRGSFYVWYLIAVGKGRDCHMDIYGGLAMIKSPVMLLWVMEETLFMSIRRKNGSFYYISSCT